MTWTDWISAAAALISVGFAAWAYWSKNASARAKAHAEEAAANAQQSLKAAENIAASLQAMPRIADALEGLTTPEIASPLIVEQGRGYTFVLRNTSGSSLTVETVCNRDGFALLRLSEPFTLQPGEGQTFMATGAMGLPLPTSIVVVITGAPAPVYVPMPQT